MQKMSNKWKRITWWLILQYISKYFSIVHYFFFFFSFSLTCFFYFLDFQWWSTTANNFLFTPPPPPPVSQLNVQRIPNKQLHYVFKSLVHTVCFFHDRNHTQSKPLLFIYFFYFSYLFFIIIIIFYLLLLSVGFGIYLRRKVACTALVCWNLYIHIYL